MSIKSILLKYSFDIKNCKPYEATVKNVFSSTKQTTYDVSCFSTVKYECAQMVSALMVDKPELKEFQYNIYVKYAVSKLLQDETVVNKLLFRTDINKFKKFIYINVELHHDYNHLAENQTQLEPFELPPPDLNRTKKIQVEPDLLDIDSE